MVHVKRHKSVKLLWWGGICSFLLIHFLSFINLQWQTTRFLAQDKVLDHPNRDEFIAQPQARAPVMLGGDGIDPIVKNCSANFSRHKPVIDNLTVLPVTTQSPKVLCYIMCTESYHQRVQIIKNTWGSHCDGFFVASNKNDTALGAVAIPMEHPHTYDKLYHKQRATLSYLYNNNISQKYDWVFKADSDSFVIVENLKAHLSQMNMSEPQLVGHKRQIAGKYDYPGKQMFEKVFKTTQRSGDRWKYTQGGAGYAMNQNFLRTFISLWDTPGCRPPEETENDEKYTGWAEDMATAFCVAATYPLHIPDSHIKGGMRELFHPNPPYQTMRKYEGKDWYRPDSISFHGFKAKSEDRVFYWMYNQLYGCREQQNLLQLRGSK